MGSLSFRLRSFRTGHGLGVLICVTRRCNHLQSLGYTTILNASITQQQGVNDLTTRRWWSLLLSVIDTTRLYSIVSSSLLTQSLGRPYQTRQQQPTTTIFYLPCSSENLPRLSSYRLPGSDKLLDSRCNSDLELWLMGQCEATRSIGLSVFRNQTSRNLF